MSVSRVRENRMHGSMRRREAPRTSRHCRAVPIASRRPYNSGAPAVISRTRGALLLSWTQASVAEFRRETLAPDEKQARYAHDVALLLCSLRATRPWWPDAPAPHGYEGARELHQPERALT